MDRHLLHQMLFQMQSLSLQQPEAVVQVFDPECLMLWLKKGSDKQAKERQKE
jgi:hypothetical protein